MKKKVAIMITSVLMMLTISLPMSAIAPCAIVLIALTAAALIHSLFIIPSLFNCLKLLYTFRIHQLCYSRLARMLANWSGVISVPSANTNVPSHFMANALERLFSSVPFPMMTAYLPSVSSTLNFPETC